MIDGFDSASFGGALLNDMANLTLRDFVVSNSSSDDNGGGLYNWKNGSVMTLVNGAVVNNSAGGFGGGIFNWDNNQLTATNVTLLGNSAQESGGGIYIVDGSVTLVNCTLTANRAASTGGVGGGFALESGGAVVLSNTLIAGNFKGTGTTSHDAFGDIAAASANNLIGVNTNLSGITNGSQGNKIGTAANPINPLLGTLANNGGPTQTHALLPGSPAIDAGGNAQIPSGITTDQRGPGFPRIVNSIVDIGALEAGLATTTTALTATPNATTGGQLVTFTATVSPNPGNLGTVSFREGDQPLTGGGSVAFVGGVATFQISTLTVGSHSVSASYSGAPGFAPSVSSAVNVVIAVPPQIVSVTPNGNVPALAGVQRSQVVSLRVVFNQPVQTDAGAFALAVHANNLSLGSIPTNLVSATTDGGTTWVVTFSGNTDPAAAGFQSIKDCVYDLNVNAASVHPLGVPGINGTAGAPFVFHRFFGDSTGEELPVVGNAHVAIVAVDDNFSFRSAFANVANYRAHFDFDGDGVIGVADNFQFRSRFNRPLTWSV